MATKEKPECPEAKKSWYNGTRLCQLTGEFPREQKFCLLESGDTCIYYEKWLKEITENE